MQYAKYGRDGPQVSRLSFGAMRLPQRRKHGGPVNFTKATAVLRRAMEAGVNLIDSHHNYHGGQSEEAIGRALKGWKGQRITVQTKTPFYRDEPMDYFKKLIDEAVEKLGVDAIDYFFFHSMDMQMFKSRGRKFLKLTDWALKKGLIRRRGFSSHETSENIKKFVDTGEFSAMLVSYNWRDPRVADAIAYAADKGMGVSVMNPIGGGVLATDTAQIRRLWPGVKSPAAIALRYVLATRGVTSALSGMNTIEQVDENVRVASLKEPMTAAQRRAMQKRLKGIKRAADKFCTACGYCMPCPNGVDIPGNFVLLNRAKFFGLIDHAKQFFRQLQNRKSGDASARACVQCGKCLPKCPNNVPIIDQLRETAGLLGG